ncbi:4-hydroxythreonine-4-phosphate dehydrogenase PdxA [Trinickia caryophylli]|uniref:4-hydroxythreonine-4-phosphate dehydrogenase n=1 Tax=Trinickia caryophylli TaxID=28094 RepID=A0A1X7H8V4_TRICW|nr:4-hydroxythreonine-4-phosphate dehydrogenase PdxA [Trinickia caryophylli]PMS09028.1 4-hydroxythreonine-4-phosphate dehydrogenase PdxA [Trinickia caryophylli]TRX14859.1 4-hydroxythreonine-4-phosphate dehydrogenase PdxA [Trinickia caryophylli]WQE14708.1 4-hydroxythreonine-4-phosphate dehydrogenase PdxA [Trinickia caryophylli]SMF81825.1 4-hydroxythreonine-4-phosphate dehydrogenase [Trinickia caryophylli]GLU31862.1 hypothetical protein Busp01_17040 [Trinickia caryophylli]
MSTRAQGSVKLIVIGDDLSGTADAAVVCRRHGLHAVVVLNAPGTEGAGRRRPAADSPAPDVLAIDTDSRRLDLASAITATREAWQRHAAGRRVYKKIDSTLRGHIAGEIATLVPLAGMAIVAPALPHAGRTTVDARQFVHGVPVETSELWRNEGMEGRADLTLLLSRAALRTAHVSLDEVRKGPESLHAQLAAFLAARTEAVICDSETDADLASIAQASAALDTVFWVGSAGLMRPLVEALAGSLAGASQATARIATPAAKPNRLHARGVLVAVGSMSSVSHRQAAMLQGSAAGSFESVEIDAATLLEPDHPGIVTLGGRVAHWLTRGRHVLVHLAQRQRMPAPTAACLTERLAHALAPAAREASALIATGGETARALLDAIGIASLTVVEEIEPGVPLLLARVPLYEEAIPVVTKAGAFGESDTLYRCWRHLVALRSPQQPPAMQAPSKEETMSSRPVIGITMGDAAGVGPEIIMKSLAHQSVYDGCRPLVIGDARRLADAGLRAGVTLRVRAIAAPAEARFAYGEVDCIDLGLIPEDLPYGKLSALAGDAAYRYIERTVALTSAGELDAICTAPLNKEALHAGGHLFPGHTEMLAKLTGIPEVSMMLVAPTLRVIHVTTHIGIIDAIRKIEPGLVLRTIERAHETLVRAGIDSPRIGVCGINPHAGENGLFGYGEEEEKIVPAIGIVRERGWDVEGPLPADTLFFRAGRGDFDVVVAMYHDQGHGPVKVMGLEAGVNVTVGLPVIRTSVDHGTAFDIAGKGIADERSMLEALKQAQDLATRRALQAA